jgi:hypothetical protein
MIECSSNIEFFNRDARKLYKIELRDNSGVHRGLTSSKKSTPVASGVYKRLPVALGSVNQDLEPGSKSQQVSVSLAASLGFKELHSGQEITRVLKNLKSGTQEFFDHKAHAFIRLLPWQMQSVKSCQLQVWLANQGQYLAMLEDGLLFDRANYNRSVCVQCVGCLSLYIECVLFLLLFDRAKDMTANSSRRLLRPPQRGGRAILGRCRRLSGRKLM